jgi:hypothetical protein
MARPPPAPSDSEGITTKNRGAAPQDVLILAGLRLLAELKTAELKIDSVHPFAFLPHHLADFLRSFP